MITCTRRLTFEAGHRVFGHESKCAHPHGHSYKVEVIAKSEPRYSETVPGKRIDTALDAIGRVVDFSVLKARVGTWIDEHWDHAFIYNEHDLVMASMLSQPGQAFRVFALPYNPTAENLAKYLLFTVCPMVLEGTGVHATHIIVHETENCWAEVRL